MTNKEDNSEPEPEHPYCDHLADAHKDHDGYRYCILCKQRVKVVNRKLVLVSTKSL
jgi:hypothetical protein